MYLGRAAPAFFPVEINTAAKEELLRCLASAPRVPCASPGAAHAESGLAELKRIGRWWVKPAQYFITCKGPGGSSRKPCGNCHALLDPKAFSVGMQQLSLDDFVPKALPDAAPAVQRLEARGMAADVAARTVRQEALQCLTKRM